MVCRDFGWLRLLVVETGAWHRCESFGEIEYYFPRYSYESADYSSIVERAQCRDHVRRATIHLPLSHLTFTATGNYCTNTVKVCAR